MVKGKKSYWLVSMYLCNHLSKNIEILQGKSFITKNNQFVYIFALDFSLSIFLHIEHIFIPLTYGINIDMGSSASDYYKSLKS